MNDLVIVLLIGSGLEACNIGFHKESAVSSSSPKLFAQVSFS